MPLVLTDQRLDLRQFPNLMPQRRGITAPQTPAALATNRRRERYHLLALIAGDQGPLVLGMPRLTARPLFRLGLGRSGFGVGMLGTGRQRRILRGLVHSAPPLIELPFQLRDPCLIVVNDRLHHARKSGGKAASCSGVIGGFGEGMPVMSPKSQFSARSISRFFHFGL